MSDERAGYIKYSEHFTVGPRLVNYMVDLGSHRYVAGIAFRPSGLYRLLGIPLTEITEGLDLALLFVSEIKIVSDQIVNATSNQEVFFFLEQFLLKLSASLKPMSAFDFAVAELVKYNGNVPIAKVADWAGISIRQFERRSYNSLGVPPKLFAQITRFSNACLYKEASPQTTWSLLAYKFGYTDQTHLIDDFKRFAGATPATLNDQISLKLVTGIEGRLHHT
ncbi:helix-turn-helix domain-containing protein [Niabella defluvii]|nr:helix-turn-helix domain-containing protein [Niabella sp. I65]